MPMFLLCTKLALVLLFCLAFHAPHVAAQEVVLKPPKEEGTWSAARLQHEIDRAIEHGSALLPIPGGTYRFANQTSLLVTRASSLILEPQGHVELVFSGDEGVNFEHCTNVTFGSLDNSNNDDKTIAIDYDPLPPPEPNFAEKSGITLNMFNCTHMKTYNLIIRAAPFLAVTAFQGGGGHLYQNLSFVPHNNNLASVRDALHFSDLREGPTVKDSIIGFSGDDFFNVHTTLLVVLECSHSQSMCTLINPYVTIGAKRNSVYGTFSLLSHVKKGDILSFYKWPNEDMIIRRIPSYNDRSNMRTNHRVHNYTIRHLQPETDPKVLAQAAKMPARTAVSHGWISVTNRTTNYTAEEAWQVFLDIPPPRTVQPGDLVAVDTINCAGAKFIQNTFLNSGCNVGRVKASNVLFRDNVFQHARVPNLEISVLPQWFEGPVEIQNIRFENNVFVFGSSKGGDKKVINPIHCGPLCEKPGCEMPPACSTCPDCSQDTPWAEHVVFVNNSFLPERSNVDHHVLFTTSSAHQQLRED